MLRDNYPGKFEAYKTLDQFSFDSYAAFIQKMLKHDLSLIDHTLISINIIRMDLFDVEKCREGLGIGHYPQMHGVLNNVVKFKKDVSITEKELLIIREYDRPNHAEAGVDEFKTTVNNRMEALFMMMKDQLELFEWIILNCTELKNGLKYAKKIRKRGKINAVKYAFKYRSFKVALKELFFYFYYILYEINVVSKYIIEPLKKLTGLRRKR